MKRLLFVFSLSTSLILILSACGKTEGCTDRLADNYDSEAEEDDGSCVYTPTVSITEKPATIEPSGNSYSVEVQNTSALSLLTLYYTASSEEFIGGTYAAETFNNPDINSTQTIEVDLLESNLLGDHTFTVEIADEAGNVVSDEFSFELVDNTDPTGSLDINLNTSEPVTLFMEGGVSFFGTWQDNYMLMSASISFIEVDESGNFIGYIFEDFVSEDYSNGFVNSDEASGVNPSTFPNGNLGTAAILLEITDAAGRTKTSQSRSFQALW